MDQSTKGDARTNLHCCRSCRRVYQRKNYRSDCERGEPEAAKRRTHHNYAAGRRACYLGWEYIIYSGRSSWSDVGSYRGYPTGAVRITAKQSGTQYHGELAAFSDTSVTVSQRGGAVHLPTSQIATLSIISYTPLSDYNEYWAEECILPPVCLLNPSLWPRLLGYRLKIEVRLFDSSMPEQDDPLTCP